MCEYCWAKSGQLKDRRGPWSKKWELGPSGPIGVYAYVNRRLLGVLYIVSGKMDRQYIGHNFDIFKYIVVISCKEYHEGNAKLLTQQKSASPN